MTGGIFEENIDITLPSSQYNVVERETPNYLRRLAGIRPNGQYGWFDRHPPAGQNGRAVVLEQAGVGVLAVVEFY